MEKALAYLRLLVDAVLDAIFPPRDAELVVRSLAPGALAQMVAPRAVMKCIPAATALLPFRTSAVRSCVHEAKFRGSVKAQELLGEALAAYLVGQQSAVLIPIPLSKERRAERGFNQCEEIIRRAHAPGFTLDASLLLRTKDTEHQTRLGRLLRRQNLEGAFTTARPADPHTIYMVVDDVVTTGATFQAAIDTLQAAGARHVIPLALAH